MKVALAAMSDPVTVGGLLQFLGWMASFGGIVVVLLMILAILAKANRPNG